MRVGYFATYLRVSTWEDRVAWELSHVCASFQNYNVVISSLNNGTISKWARCVLTPVHILYHLSLFSFTLYERPWATHNIPM